MADRIQVLKTYKIYIGGKFPRSESERTYPVTDATNNLIANACLCTRKDVREAVTAARAAFNGWDDRSAYNRGQIIYRIAEILESRKQQFIDELVRSGSKTKHAVTEVETSIDRLIYYSGWTDKLSQVFGTINPVASPHFNFSVPEPSGIVGIIAPDNAPLLSIISLMAPVICGGNTCVIIASEKNPLPAVSFSEVLHASDVPGGVVNILSGYRDEMVDSLTSHMDVNGILNSVKDKKIMKLTDENGSLSIKRVYHYATDNWQDEIHESPYIIHPFLEIKTTWHPVSF
jgi:acyl-CoA reductase-like NAD-dependent aldehyde dehydrogenase